MLRFFCFVGLSSSCLKVFQPKSLQLLINTSIKSDMNQTDLLTSLCIQASIMTLRTQSTSRNPRSKPSGTVPSSKKTIKQSTPQNSQDTLLKPVAGWGRESTRSPMVGTWAVKNLPRLPGRVHKALSMRPINWQERQISMPGPGGTADTEIGCPGHQYLGIAFSNANLFPAQSSNKTKDSTQEMPPTPESATGAGQWRVPRKVTNLN